MFVWKVPNYYQIIQSLTLFYDKMCLYSFLVLYDWLSIKGPRLLPDHQAPDGLPDHQRPAPVPGVWVAHGGRGGCEAGLQQCRDLQQGE